MITEPLLVFLSLLLVTPLCCSPSEASTFAVESSGRPAQNRECVHKQYQRELSVAEKGTSRD